MTLSSEVHDLSLLVTPRPSAEDEADEGGTGDDGDTSSDVRGGNMGDGERGGQAAKERVQELEAEVRDSD